MNWNNVSRLLVLALALGLAACTGGAGSTTSTPDAKVMKRAAERWTFLIERQPEKAWEYLSRGVQSTQGREAYAIDMKSRPVRWLRVKPLDAECSAERCDVRLEVWYEVVIPGGGGDPVQAPAYIYERWIRQGSSWVHVPNEFLGGGCAD